MLLLTEDNEGEFNKSEWNRQRAEVEFTLNGGIRSHTSLAPRNQIYDNPILVGIYLGLIVENLVLAESDGVTTFRPLQRNRLLGMMSPFQIASHGRR